jgi:uncharacterized protein with HEPN domain
MTKYPPFFLKHILESIDLIASYLRETNKTEFYKDAKLQDAVIRRLEIIGEAAKGLPPEFTRKYPAIDWRGMSGMRDKLIHHYFGINLERVWLVLKNDLPKLKKDLEVILDDENKVI